MRFGFVFILGLIFFQIKVYCQLSSRLDLEAGYFNIRNAALNQEENIIMRTEGELSFSHSGDFSSFIASARIRPEWYGIETRMRSLKMGAQAGFQNEGESFGYGFEASAARNLYKIYQPAISHDLLSLQADFTYNLPSQYVLHFSPGYYRQNVRYENEQITDIMALELSAGHQFITGLNSEGGIYAEGFSINKLPESQPLILGNTTKGLKIGPELNLSYSDSRIITLQYRFLFVNSKYTKFPSYEQMVRFLAGILSEDNISIMLLADYYWHKIRVLNGYDNAEAAILSYSSLNYENRILLKIGYEVTETMEIFLRTGYSGEDLLNDKFSEKSWSLMFGLSFTK